MPDGKFYEFAYYDYHGKSDDADMETLVKEPRNIAWLEKTDATQTPHENHKGWAVMECIFFNP
jgi:L-rhamnose mutarotase